MKIAAQGYHPHAFPSPSPRPSGERVRVRGFRLMFKGFTPMSKCQTYLAKFVIALNHILKVDNGISKYIKVDKGGEGEINEPTTSF